MLKAYYHPLWCSKTFLKNIFPAGTSCSSTIFSRNAARTDAFSDKILSIFPV